MTTPEPIGPRYQRRNIVLSAGNDWVATFTPLDAAGGALPALSTGVASGPNRSTTRA